MTIDLNDVAKYYKAYPHQVDALDWLEREIPTKTLREFEKKWRQSSDGRLSKNFTLAELTKSSTAARYGINNVPTDPTVLKNLENVAKYILQPVRDHFGRPVIVSSGYRSPILNRKINGSSTSEHMSGKAADFEIYGISNKKVATWIAHNLEFNQLILEFWDGTANGGWIHCSYSDVHNKNITAIIDKNGYRNWNP